MSRVRLLVLMAAAVLIVAGCTTSGRAVPAPSTVTPTNPTSASATTSPTTTTPDNPALDVCDILGLLPCARQVAQVSLPIAGTDIRLTYSSDRAPGRLHDQAPSAAGLGLGGWTLSVLDSLDPATKTLISGIGRLRKVTGVADGGQTLVADPSGSFVDSFDANGRATAVLDAITGATLETFAWGDHGLTTVSDSSGVALTVIRANDGSPIQLTATNGASTFLSETAGALTSVVYPDGSTAQITDASGGLVSELVDPTGIDTQYEYDAEGRLSTSIDGTGARTTYSRELKGDTLTVQTQPPVGGAVVDTVSTVGAATMWSHADAAGATQSLVANSDQLTLTEPDGTKAMMTLAPDPRWGMDAPLPSKIVDAGAALTAGVAAEAGATGVQKTVSENWSVDGNTWKFGYDPASRTATQTDPNGATTTAGYDSSGRVTSTVNPGTAPVAYTYGGQGRITSITFGTGPDARTWTYTYSASTVTITDPVGGVQIQSLTPTGAITQVAGPGAAGLVIARDSSDRITGFAAAAGGEYRVTWGANGQVAAQNSPSGQGGPQFTGFDYDQSGKLIKQFTADTTLTITRDDAGRIAAYNAGAGDVSTAYDSADRLASVTSPSSTVAHTYTGAALTGETVAGPVQSGLSRTVDNLGRTTGLDVSGGVKLGFGYDSAGQVVMAGDLSIRRDAKTGLISTETLGSLTASFAYNPFGEQVGEKITGPGGAQVSAIADTRDKLGRLTTVATTVGSATTMTAYTYDPSGRLGSETVDGARTAYTYDPAGNLTTVTDSHGQVTEYTYDGRNALVKMGDTSYTYDGAGQLATASSPAGKSTYHYDAAGRLLSVSTPGKPVVSYTVDGFGRRIATSVGGKTTGGIAYLDPLRPAAELDPSGKVLQQYVYSGTSSNPDYVEAAGTDYLEVPDATGGPGLVINAGNGAIADRVIRTALGTTVSESDPGFQLIGYGGGIVDPNTDLVRFGARDYDTTTGRWTAPDPLSVNGGSANLYEHVNGDPVNQSDPTGQCDYGSLGLTAGGGLGGYGSVSGGFASAGGEFGLYGSWGFGVGAGAGVGGVVNCLDQNNPSDTPPGLDPFGGKGKSSDTTIGPLSGGGDEGSGPNGPYSHGWHAGLGGGTPAGGSITGTRTGFICLVGCPPPMITICGSLGCNSFPTTPNGKPASSNDTPTSASSNGEPHTTTADGVRYSLQAVGEFTWLTTDSGDLTVQVRQQPYRGSRTVSVNTAAAVSVDGDRLQIAHPAGYPWNLAVSAPNGAVAAVGTFTLPHGATVVRAESTVTITSTDGTRLLINANPFGLDVNATLPDSLHGHVHGLVGPFTGAAPGEGTVQTRGGAMLTATQLGDFNTFYRTFGDSWRITQAQSLFIDDPGKDASAFNDPTFPDRNPPPTPVASLALAKTICAQLDLVGVDLTDCIQDVSLTGDAGFASSMARATDTVPGAAAPTASSVTANGIAPGQTVHGTIAANGKNTYPVTVTAGTVGYFAAAPGCTDPSGGKNSIIWYFDDPSGGSYTGSTYICSDQGRVVFTKAGTYQLVVSGNDGASGAYSVVWETSRPDDVRSLTTGSTAAGTIDLPGARDVYTLAVTAGTVGYFAAAPGCTTAVGTLAWYVLDPSGGSYTGETYICSDQGRVLFTKTGTYELVVASIDGHTSPYSVTWKTSRPDLIRSLGAGETAGGTIDLPGADDVYSLSVTAGTVGYFAAAPGCTDPSSGPLYWHINYPDGGSLTASEDICSDQGRVLFPTTGTYQLVVASSGGSTGSYSMTWKLSRPDLVRPLAIGTAVSGNIDLAGAQDVWTFAAVAGTKVNFAAATGCSPEGLNWQVEYSDNTSLSASVNICTDLGELTFPTAGIYKVVVSGYNQGTGPYSFMSTSG